MASDWQEVTLGEIAREDYGLVDGPFGSNLPASDYTTTGVPVIRGGNLSLGESRFNNDEFVFVSEVTAQRLARSLCYPGDIIFTKKGTLGQTGIVPNNPRFDKFLLSSNQMKLSVDTKKADPLFIY
jgi:type I restriction enzyme, S subunit